MIDRFLKHVVPASAAQSLELDISLLTELIHVLLRWQPAVVVDEKIDRLDQGQADLPPPPMLPFSAKPIARLELGGGQSPIPG